MANEMKLRPVRGSADRPRIVDLVFAEGSRAPIRRLAIGIAAVLGLYGGLVVAVLRLGRSASGSRVQLVAPVPELPSAERAVDVWLPAPLPLPGPSGPEVSPVARPRSRSHPARARAAIPAQAGRRATATAERLADFTGTTFVMGSADSAGGPGRPSGTGRGPGHGAGDSASAPAGGGLAASLARPVALDQGAWACPWPEEADAQQVDEQTVVVRARVRSDGRAEGVEILSDPGFGFAEAARLCALRTRFEPARDARGRSVAASSPPIRVHFFR